MSATCPIRIYSRERWASSIACGRPIKTEGADRCNMHLAAQRRSEQNAVERNRARDEEQERRRSAEAICSALASHGLAASVYLDWSTRTFTGDVVLTAQSARDLLARLDQTVIHAEPRT